MFHLNTLNSLHSYIKNIYDHYRGGTKYINRYNAMHCFQSHSGVHSAQPAISFRHYALPAISAIGIALRIHVTSNRMRLDQHPY